MAYTIGVERDHQGFVVRRRNSRGLAVGGTLTASDPGSVGLVATLLGWAPPTGLRFREQTAHAADFLDRIAASAGVPDPGGIFG